MKFTPVVCCLLITLTALGGEEAEDIAGIPHIGFFTHDRQPNTNFGFGQNIIPKGKVLAYVNLAQNKGHDTNLVAIAPQLLYGISNSFSLQVLFPVLPYNALNGCKAKGVSNISTQIEYAFYQGQTHHSATQATLVANISLPTAHTWSSCQLLPPPSSGFNATNFFLGVTASYISTQWYGYVSPGITLTTQNHGLKMGNQFLYQGGGGYYLCSLSKAIIVLLIDINGTYSQKDRSNGYSNSNTGGNTILMGPSIAITGNHWEFKGGIEFPALQRLNGSQNKQIFQTLLSTSILF